MPSSATESVLLLPGLVIDAPDRGSLRSLAGGAVAVQGPLILAAGTEAEMKAQFPAARPVEWPEGSVPVIVPGLIDVHAHVPQYPAVARVEGGLLPWLRRRIFPLERGFTADRPGITAELDAFFACMAAAGTTTAMLYAAVWEDSCSLAFEAAERAGLRVIMGKVMMDRGSYGGGSEWPEEQTRAVSLAETRRLIERWHGAAGGRLEYAVSPRFAVTCTAELMHDAAELARVSGCRIQTHLSENHDEVRSVLELFPAAASYTDVYERAGLLGPRAMLAHCIHLTGGEIALLASRGAAVAHCPSSNFFLNSGLCPLDRLHDAGLRIGLGSDVAGGPELDLWRVMRSAIEMQKARRFHDDRVPELTPAQAFHLATAGGAAALGLEDRIGRIAPGYDADLLVLDAAELQPFSAEPQPITADEAIALAIYRSHPGAVLAVLAGGRTVHRHLPGT